jgi:carboxyl-terminal processing protease
MSNDRANYGVLDKFIDNLLKVIHENSVRNMTFNGMEPIDWPAYDEVVLNEFNRNRPESIHGVEPIVQYALEKLNDGHSHVSDFLNTPETRPARSFNHADAPPFGRLISNKGYILVPSFSPPNKFFDEGEKLFAQIIHDEINNIDATNPDGWIVDLRANPGGGSDPMVAGIGPLIGNGIHGYFLNTNNQFYNWSYNDGSYGSVVEQVEGLKVERPYSLKNPAPPIAVLVGPATASAGEVTLISFMGLPNVKTFGHDSTGQSTPNIGVYITTDGDVKIGEYNRPNLTKISFGLTTGLMADRNKNIYGDKISPDFRNAADPVPFYKILQKDYSLENDPVVQQAIAWLDTQKVRQPAPTDPAP